MSLNSRIKWDIFGCVYENIENIKTYDIKKSVLYSNMKCNNK